MLSVTSLLLAGSLAIAPAGAVPQADEPRDGDVLLDTAADVEEAGDEDSDALGVELGVTVVSEYWWRGYVYEDDGAIVQPHLEWSTTLVEGEEDDDVWVELFLGNWNSFHSEKTDATGPTWDAWYETDLYGGLAMGQGPWELDVTYLAYIYPNTDEFDTVHELGFELGVDLDDESVAGQLLGDPKVGVFVEVHNSNVRTYDDEAAYAELGFGPSFELAEGAATLEVPIRFGMSLDDYYVERNGRSRTFGYASIGAEIAIPLDVSDELDTTLSFGGTWHTLGDAAEEVNGGDDDGGFLFAALTVEF